MTLEKNNKTDGETSRSFEDSSSKPIPQSPDEEEEEETEPTVSKLVQQQHQQQLEQLQLENEPTKQVVVATITTSGEETELNTIDDQSESDFIIADWNLSSATESNTSEEMKRTNAKKLIERYFYQLSNGCGNPNCANRYCASSGAIKNLTPNQAAARALQLFSIAAQLCDVQQQHGACKIARSKSPPHGAFLKNVNHSSNDGDAAIAATDVNSIGSINGASNDRQPLENHSSTEDGEATAQSTSLHVPTENSENQQQEPKQQLQTNVKYDKNKMAQTSTVPSNLENMPYLDENNLYKLIEYCKKTDSYAPLIRNLGRLFSSREHLTKSFQRQPSTHIDEMLQKAPKDLKILKKEDFRTLEGDLDKDDDSSCTDDDKFTAGLASSTHRSHTTVDLLSLRRAMTHLIDTTPIVFDAINNAIQTLAIGLSVDLRIITQRDQIEDIITVFVIIFEIIMISKIDFVEVALPSLCQAAAHLPVWAQARLIWIWSAHCQGGIGKLLETLQQLISLQVIAGTYNENVHVQDNETIVAATKVMKILYYTSIVCGQLESPKFREDDADADAAAELLDDDTFIGYNTTKKSKTEIVDALAKELNINIQDCRRPLIPFEEFYNDPLSDAIEMDQDYLNYKNSSDKQFSFMLYSFILTPATKIQGLYYDCRIRMYTERRMHIIQSQMGQSSNPYLKVRVRRDHLIDDALVELEMIAMGNPKDLKKQLVVEFVDEQGIDEGGVSKEFFQMVVEEIFNPDYGMFIYNEDTQTMWFNSTSFENEAQFTLIGIVLGLAIYNNIILAVNFPMVVYRKLMGIRGSFRDLKDWNPTMYHSLLDMLNYQEMDMEDVFMQTFRISYQDVFGSVLTHDLKKDCENMFVNQDNKQEFVDLYADYLLNTSVERKFRAFRRGFQMVTDESPLHLLFRAEEIELLVCGSKDFDFNELEKATEYEGGFTEKSQTIVDFWDIVHALSTDSKRKLLEFTTGSDRVPVGGLSRLKLVIARNGSDSDRLPTSHTCYNVLLLPEYTTKEKLEERLLKAINYSKGFGMI